MTVNIQKRMIVANAINAFLVDAIDSWAFDDGVCVGFDRKHKDDWLCDEISQQLYLLYDDTRRYKNSVRPHTPDIVAMMRRWERLLRSNIEWSNIKVPIESPIQGGFWRRCWMWLITPGVGPKPKFKANLYWPLSSAEEWETVFDREHGNT